MISIRKPFFRNFLIAGTAVFFLVFSACTTTRPGIFIFPSTGGGELFYFPSTVWETEAGRRANVTAHLDITHITEEGKDVICNISFIDNRGLPENVSQDISISAYDTVIQLNDVEILFLDHEINTYRITSNFSPQELFELSQMDEIVLTATVDDTAYQFYPPKMFFIYLSQYFEIIATQ